MALLGAFMALGNAQAQEILSLSDAIKHALENKADAKKSRLEMENAEYKIQEVRSQALPQLNFNGELKYNPLLQKVALPGEIVGQPGTTIMAAFGQKWQSTGSVALTQQIFNQTVFTGLKAARTTREFYQINNTLTEEQLIEKVANSYYDIYQTQLQLKTVESNLASTSRIRDVIAGQFQNGLAKKIDLDRTTVGVNNLLATKQQLQNALTLKENALKFIIGMSIDKDIDLPEDSFQINSADLFDQASTTNQRTEVLLLQKQSELLQLNRKAIEADYYPKLSFTGNFGYLGMGPSIPLFSSKTGVNWSSFSGLGLNLSIPIFNGFLTRSKVRQANIEIQKLEVDIQDTKLGLTLAAENARVQMRNSLVTINVQAQNVKLASDVQANFRNNYNNGLAPLTDLLDAEKAFAEAENNYTTALLNYKIAEIQLKKSEGKLKTLINE